MKRWGMLAGVAAMAAATVAMADDKPLDRLCLA